LASWWRAQFVVPVVGVTGSVGKTSVKEMLGAIFAEIGSGLVTKGNLNNEIGLPLTLLRLNQNDRYAIVEMGMNQAGEIARLTQIAKPTIALVNNAAAAHLEGLGTVAAVANAKGEIFQGLSEDGVGIINADDQYADIWRELIGARRIISFGLQDDADVTANYEPDDNGIHMQVSTPDDSYDVRLPTIGKHNVSNSLAAIAVATAAHIPVEAIRKGLSKYRPIAGRLNFSRVGATTLIDDTYNANPASMQAAIEVLAQFDDSTLIVGDMAELGDAAALEHQRLGELANQFNIDRLYACGEYAQLVIQDFSGDARAFATQSELIAMLADNTRLHGTILVKGSRSAKMERVVEQLLASLQSQTSSTQEGSV